jgi:hypothetical protein
MRTGMGMGMGIAMALAMAACKDSGAGPSDGSAGTTGGSGGAAGGVVCPSSPPQAGGACNGPEYCIYEDCSGVGRTAAICRNGAWLVDRATCAETLCNSGDGGNIMCPASRICLQRGIDAIEQAMCVQNNCGAGPISCSCLEGCSGTCTVIGNATSGARVRCDS